MPFFSAVPGSDGRSGAAAPRKGPTAASLLRLLRKRVIGVARKEAPNKVSAALYRRQSPFVLAVQARSPQIDMCLGAADQFFCISRTFSGQWSEGVSASSKS